MCGADIYRTLLEHMRDGVYVVDRARSIVEWNPAAERITGYLRQDVYGRQCQQDLLMHCTTAGDVVCGEGCPLTRVMEEGVARETVLFLRHRNGHRVPVRIRSTPVRDSGGAVVGAVEMFREARGQARRASEPDQCLDEDTRLASREYAEFRLAQCLARLERFAVPLGWIRVELDDAPSLAQRLGCSAVPAAIRLVARALESNAEEAVFLARWDATGFRAAVETGFPVDLLGTVRRLEGALRSAELEWWGDLVRLTAAVAGVPARSGDTIETLELRAETALAAARSSGESVVLD
jgi:PAS domain S-box-containing protein